MSKADETPLSVMCGGVRRMILSTQDICNSKRALFCSTEQKHVKINRYSLRSKITVVVCSKIIAVVSVQNHNTYFGTEGVLSLVPSSLPSTRPPRPIPIACPPIKPWHDGHIRHCSTVLHQHKPTWK